jgi:ABC-type Fe3+/spermidine/putrescine transport system ATPase subunit
MASLSVSNISKSFGSTRVLDQISIEVGSGEFFALLGPSGCGKSTLLRIIAGLETPDSGSVSIDGARIDNIPPQKRGIGMVFQQYALWPHMTIAQNVRFGLENQRLSESERDERMREALALVQMADLAKRYPHEISGGQQQRVALARALAMRPSIILLDEPLSNLDARLRAEIRHELAELHRTLNATMIYVTHDQEDALALSTRIAIMNRGRIEQIDTPSGIYRSPSSTFCAKFIGDANLMPATVIESSAGGSTAIVQLDCSADRSIKVRVSGALPDKGCRGSLCIRPSAVALRSLQSDASGSASLLSAGVIRTSYRGAEYGVELKLADGTNFHATVRASDTQEELTPGAQVGIYWPDSEAFFIPSRG